MNDAVSKHAGENAKRVVELYYQYIDQSDLSERLKVCHLYKEDASVLWNGTPIPGVAALVQLVNALPASRHAVTSYDFHTLPDSATSSATPKNMIVQMTGFVTHANSPQQPLDPADDRTSHNKSGRVFNQTMLLEHASADEIASAATGAVIGLTTLQYRIRGDTYRFVG